MLIRFSHAQCEADYKKAWDAFCECRRQLEVMTRDRDEWKQQHENLLAVRQQDLQALTSQS